MNTFLRNIGIWLVIGLVMLMLFNLVGPRESNERKITFSEFISQIESGSVLEVSIRGSQIHGVSDTNGSFQTQTPNYPALFEILDRHQVRVRVEPTDQTNLFMAILNSWLPMILIIGIWLFFMRQVQGGGNRAMGFGKIRSRITNTEDNPIKFEDVQGIDESREELEEIVDFLKDPGKFERLGGEIPRGVLLMGEPGTGKTLLAKAIAGEAAVPFFSISGSDFVEMFVGVGASRVRDMFAQGKKHAPCIIFIDEIDAVGRSRGAGLGGGNDEREQTLNQLLVEMDGFEVNEGIIVIAATNRPDVLDPALLRPGRFDRHVVVPLPDIKGRENILKTHSKNIELNKEVNLNTIARGTPGFTGADLANLVNEAALWAARQDKDAVGNEDFEYARDKVMMGAERRSLMITDEEKETTAYHEVGHALVAASIEEVDPVHKVSIIPRGRALGVTMLLPEEDRHSHNKRALLGQIAMMMGGRAAEHLVFKRYTTGASDDLKKATELARKMVCQWGMSENLGPLTYTEDEGHVFLGRDLQQHKEFSNDSMRMIDEEVLEILNSSYERAKKILKTYRKALDSLAKTLLEIETIDGDGVLQAMQQFAPKTKK
ncbi:MAG TPA: ATP-dependent metallopeptidase FtsH/Yme1/Tma family protein [Deltaproteobacteria bacterium]|nr:cell division protein FtsH [Deltaproteobacteria bacterium]HIB94511.1 ATP-dependent metallopeptidase FtsH/Yme1/Tma family protein [Candidatus Lambdaproteobacteria bacterium]HIN47745.1 ATP-dependent metallopeptidase FtsH/Yme1/Tma family protein [Deltaproteobacteria bacterium]HIO60430.1 ATP-dependent metallopeptidase FtsH/Yme1/Tma family protein [Deltaproteobacteria bacterium]HIO83613.1 ATP-dependent metallopeptidase FtsH/Yme1/Tma family protein [Deltaproteobacteria bacterium]